MIEELDKPTGAWRSVMLCGALAMALGLAACDQQSSAPTPSEDSGEDTAAMSDEGMASDDTSSDDMASDDMADTGSGLYEPPTEDADPQLSAERRGRVAEMAEDWPSEPVYAYHFDALDPSVSVSASEAGAMFDPRDDYWGLPRTEGYMLVDQNCTACHSVRIVMQQHQTEERWDYLLTWMVEEQGMWELPDEERETILAYLVEHFGPADE